MQIIGHGIDLVEVVRIEKMLADHGQRFRDRCFTKSEQAYCDASKKRAAEHYAARFAAKEAVLKAIGTGWRDGIAWTDIEIVRLPTGRPELYLAGNAGKIAGDLGMTTWFVSLSHTDSAAIASVIGGSDD